MCRCISDVFVGRKVISTSYSSAILKLLPDSFCFMLFGIIWILLEYVLLL